MANTLEKETYLVRSALESPSKHFVYEKSIDENYRKFFKYVTQDQQLLAFAMDNCCMTSDCYILYAIAHLGVADKESISLFLEALATKYPELNVVYKKARDGIKDRLRALANMGFIFRYQYDVNVKQGAAMVEDTVGLFTLVDTGYDIVKQRLQKRLVVNSAIQYKPMSELIGWAAAAYVGASIASASTGFVDYLERVLRTKQLGAVYMPAEVKTCVDGVNYYTAVVSSYLYRNEMAQTENDFAEYCAFKINTIKNYICCRTTKGVPVVVVTVADNADLMEITSLIYKTGILNPYLEQVYFTGEGIVKERNNMKHSFLRMVIDTNEEMGYKLIYSAAPFI